MTAVFVQGLGLASLQHFADVGTAYVSVGRRRQHQILLRSNSFEGRKGQFNCGLGTLLQFGRGVKWNGFASFAFGFIFGLGQVFIEMFHVLRKFDSL